MTSEKSLGSPRSMSTTKQVIVLGTYIAPECVSIYSLPMIYWSTYSYSRIPVRLSRQGHQLSLQVSDKATYVLCLHACFFPKPNADTVIQLAIGLTSGSYPSCRCQYQLSTWSGVKTVMKNLRLVNVKWSVLICFPRCVWTKVRFRIIAIGLELVWAGKRTVGSGIWCEDARGPLYETQEDGSIGN